MRKQKSPMFLLEKNDTPSNVMLPACGTCRVVCRRRARLGSASFPCGRAGSTHGGDRRSSGIVIFLVFLELPPSWAL